MGATGWRKRLRKSRKLLSSPQGETEKLSQRLIQIAKPYLGDEDNLDEYQKELMFASTAWNLSLFPPDSREETMMKGLDGLGEPDRQLIAQHVRELIQRKEQLFPSDRRMIASVKVLDEGDSLRVLVASVS